MTLLDHVTWQVGDRDRVGLCGPNGAGKTTLLRMLAGLRRAGQRRQVLRPNALTIGYLPQDGLAHSGRTVVDEASLALKPLLDMKAEMHDLEASARRRDGAATTSTTRCCIATASCRSGSASADGYHLELKVATVLRGLGFEHGDFDKLTDHLSGGWQMRLALAKLLLGAARPAAARRADQPPRSRGAQLARGVPRRLSALGHPRLARSLLPRRRRHPHRRSRRCARSPTTTATTRSIWCSARRSMTRLREAKKRQDEEIARVQEFIDRFRYKATKAAQVQSRIKMLEKVERIEVPPERKRIHFQFPPAPKSGRMVLELKDARKAYGDEGRARRASTCTSSAAIASRSSATTAPASRR